MALLEKISQVRLREELRRLLGWVKYVTPSLPMVAAYLAEWNELTSTKRLFVWTDNAERLLTKLKADLKLAVVRAPPDPELLLESFCDSSNLGGGGVIFQRGVDGALHILRCWSSAYGPTQREKAATENELHALYVHLTKMEAYVSLIGDQRFKVYTDCLPLLAIVEHLDASKLRSMTRNVTTRKLYYIGQFDGLDLEYVPGDTNIADLLTRSPFVRAPIASELGLTETPETTKRKARKATTETSVNVVTRGQRRQQDELEEAARALADAERIRAQRREPAEQRQGEVAATPAKTLTSTAAHVVAVPTPRASSSAGQEEPVSKGKGELSPEPQTTGTGGNDAVTPVARKRKAP